LYPSITQPVQIALALLGTSEDGKIGREEFAHDVCKNGGLVKLGDGDGVIRCGGGSIDTVSAVSSNDGCDVGEDAGEDGAASVYSMVTTTGGRAGCAFIILCCEFDDDTASYVALSDLVSHDCEHA
jgi:hypothetical protein